MAEPTIAQVFGDNATQDTNTITITKADLVSTGLTASANNTAEWLCCMKGKKDRPIRSKDRN
ncbi:hypothetical protein IQ243_09535 [Nostocales cyanobacterium LEGE 11386]|nr:hypothetical protein [Nostocales cyanobacterium LEGE 11386]